MTTPVPKTNRVSLYDWPRLTRFYGIGPAELARTPHAILRIYADALMELVAEEAIHGFMTADMPHAKEADRKSIFRRFSRYLAREDEAEKIDARSEAGMAAAASLGIAIDIPKPEVES